MSPDQFDLSQKTMPHLSDSRRRVQDALLEIDLAQGSILQAAALLSTIEGLSRKWEELGELAEKIKEIHNAVENAGRSVE